MSHSMFYEKDKNCQIYHVIWRPSWNLANKKKLPKVVRVATKLESFYSDPKIRIIKKFIGKNISRLGNSQID